MSQHITPSRFKINSKPKDVNGSLSPAKNSRAKSVPPDVKKDSKFRRSLLVNKPKSGEVAACQKSKENEDVRVVGRSASASASVNSPVVEQFARPRRSNLVGSIARRNEEETHKELQEKVELKEYLIKDLQCQVLSLKAELEKAHSLNKELVSHNQKLAQDLAAAQAKVAALNTRKQPIGEVQSPEFNNISSQLEHLTVKKYPPPPPAPTHLLPKAVLPEREAPSCPSSPIPPPPPPPPLMRPIARAVSAPKTPAIVEFYHSLRKQEEKRDIQAPRNQYKSTVTSAHNSIVGEIQNRSAHLLAIKADVKTKGDFINGLIQKVVALAYTDIEDVLKFVDWLDDQLSTLADERAVLKHFNWPERKADAIREAAIEYRSLKQLESEISSFRDDTNIPCETAMKKMAVLLDKSERGIGRLVKLRNSVLHSYQDWRIPINWMLDSGIVSKIKQGSMKLAKMYMRRVIMELEVARNLDRESNQEALVLQGVHFAYRAHQFAGGLDSETLCAFEEIRQRVPVSVPGHLGGSRELLAAVPSS